jgi:hypothetical protein
MSLPRSASSATSLSTLSLPLDATLSCEIYAHTSVSSLHSTIAEGLRGDAVATASAESGPIQFGDVCGLLERVAQMDLSNRDNADAAVEDVARCVKQIRISTSNEKFTKLKELSNDLVTATRESASSIGLEDDPELRDDTSDTGNYLNNEEETAGRVDESETVGVSAGVMPVEVTRRKTRSDTACAGAAPSSPQAAQREPRVFVDTPRTVAEGLKDTESDARPGDCYLGRKFKVNLVGKKQKPMRSHPLGSDQRCSGLLADFHQCASLVYNHDIPLPDRMSRMCDLLEDLIEGALVLYDKQIVVAQFNEELFQELHQRTIRVLCGMLSPDLKVYDIRRKPYLVLKEGDVYFTGYGDVLVTLLYTLKSGKKAEIAVCVNELKKDALSFSNGVGQTAGQILHFNGRHLRRFKLESIVTQPLHFCSGVLTNPVAAVGLTVANERGVSVTDRALFVVELAKGKPLWCILTMLLRALELRDIVSGTQAKAEPRELDLFEPLIDDDDGDGDGDGDGTGDPAADGGDAGLGDSPPPNRGSNLGSTEPSDGPKLDGSKGKSHPTPPSDDVPCDSDDESACWSDLDEVLGTADDVLEIKAVPPPLVLRFSGQTAVERFFASVDPCQSEMIQDCRTSEWTFKNGDR